MSRPKARGGRRPAGAAKRRGGRPRRLLPLSEMILVAIAVVIVLVMLFRPAPPPPAAPAWRPRWAAMSFAREDGRRERHIVGGQGGSWIRSPSGGEAIEIPDGAVFATVEP